MRRSGACLCLTALQLFALERRKSTSSYKYFEDAASIRAAFDRLTDAARDTLEQSEMALRHDVALHNIFSNSVSEAATDQETKETKTAALTHFTIPQDHGKEAGTERSL
ncbi:uncharacterized protein Tco025E_05782 [Trypanosoma conorhini]|uniref:Uncharacterized protein n=1 Tax=Trypanosoma conorhini TaxID=83891 RepID=A0A3R7P8Z6_9TRYP|nr:uncharacterized protein Tco025E_05782 [Trypanosoma conorhini]RNF14701.1 hypothetical protein Tco025E_05782 [Trypanosoma conorhini]